MPCYNLLGHRAYALALRQCMVTVYADLLLHFAYALVLPARLLFRLDIDSSNCQVYLNLEDETKIQEQIILVSLQKC
jgi:hypothetical protein